MVTRHGRGSIAGSGRAQEASGSALTLWIEGMRLSGVPEKLAVAVCSTVGLPVCWARIKTDLLLKRCPP